MEEEYRPEEVRVFRQGNWVLRWEPGKEREGNLSFLGVNDEALLKATLYYKNLLGEDIKIHSVETLSPTDTYTSIIKKLTFDLFSLLPEHKRDFIPITMEEWAWRTSPS